MKKWIAILALCLPVLACTFDESQLRTAEGSVAGADARLAADSLLIADTGSGVVPDAFSVVDRVFAQDTPCTQDAPTGVTAMADNRRVTLAWKAAAGAVSYSILRSTTTGVGYLDVGPTAEPGPRTLLSNRGRKNRRPRCGLLLFLYFNLRDQQIRGRR